MKLKKKLCDLFSKPQTSLLIKFLFSIPVLFSLGLASSCSNEPVDDPIPYQPFPDIVINLSLPEFISLSLDGGHVNTSGGIRGIILYRENSNTYHAYERNCSYHPNDACATIEVHLSGLYMEDPCCGSIFNFPDGFPTGGVAWRPLVQYETILNGSTLTITDRVL